MSGGMSVISPDTSIKSSVLSSQDIVILVSMFCFIGLLSLYKSDTLPAIHWINFVFSRINKISCGDSIS
uniref:Uncharacterized protein n=1 Tax=uncultured marine virus TaxID=186617 RepID=A0A0F7L302_9VIRU|nr:hypothetical protein [uncultured marine virus]